MDYEKTSNMDTSIYLNDYSCNCLWDELQNMDDSKETTPSAKKKSRDDENDSDFARWPIAMTYVPMQPWEEPFELAKGLRAGTIFPSLRLPFRGGGC